MKKVDLMKNDLDVRQAKVWLYHLLLNKSNDELTGTEIDMMYNLSKDKYIQNVLSKNAEVTR